VKVWDCVGWSGEGGTVLFVSIGIWGRLEGVSMNTSTSISGVSKVIHSHDTRRRRNGVPIPYALARCNS